MPSIFIAAALAVGPALTYVLLAAIYRRLTSPWRYIPGPKDGAGLTIGWRENQDKQSHEIVAHLAHEYGHVLKYTGYFGVERLYTTDIVALSHIINNGYDYQRQENLRWIREHLIGDGLLSAEGEKHRQQRRAMNPAFGTGHISRLTEIFVNKTLELRAILEKECDENDGKFKIDSVEWFRRLTLDIIGLAGFNRDFEALSPAASAASKELHKAFLVRNVPPLSLTLERLKSYVPAFRILPDFNTEAYELGERRLKIGQALLKESRTAALDDKGDNFAGRDILSLLIKANLSDKEGQKMTDRQVVAQIATFILAGHETTSTSSTWALYAMCRDKRVQTKLRDELLSLNTDNPTMDELNSLTYLDHVVKETMRYHSPVAFLTRVATKDDIIPLGKPYTDIRGVQHSVIPVRKGQEVEIPILAVNVDKSLWGEDAMEFKPERWESPPKAITEIPGIWSDILSFLGGAHSCIGFKFSVVEMKAILYTLVRAFEFDFAVDANEIERSRSFAIIERPILMSDPDRHVQLPLYITPVRRRPQDL